MSEEYTLRWEQVVGARVVKKQKFFISKEKRDHFRKEVMQKKQFFKLLPISDTRR